MGMNPQKSADQPSAWLTVEMVIGLGFVDRR
jgi:hypothetical protein